MKFYYISQNLFFHSINQLLVGLHKSEILIRAASHISYRCYPLPIAKIITHYGLQIIIYFTKEQKQQGGAIIAQKAIYKKFSDDDNNTVNHPNCCNIFQHIHKFKNRCVGYGYISDCQKR